MTYEGDQDELLHRLYVALCSISEMAIPFAFSLNALTPQRLSIIKCIGLTGYT